MKRAIGTVGMVGLAAFGSVACSDDDGDGNLATWCRLGGEINDALEGGGQVSDEMFSDFVDAASSDIRDATETAAAAFEESPETAFEDPDVQGAVADIEAYHEGNCQ